MNLWYNFKLIYCNLFQDMFPSSNESSATGDSSDSHALRYSSPTSWELFRDKQTTPHPRSSGLGHYSSLQLSAVSVPAPITSVGGNTVAKSTEDKQCSFSEQLFEMNSKEFTVLLYYSEHRKRIWLQNSEELSSIKL